MPARRRCSGRLHRESRPSLRKPENLGRRAKRLAFRPFCLRPGHRNRAGSFGAPARPAARTALRAYTGAPRPEPARSPTCTATGHPRRPDRLPRPILLLPRNRHHPATGQHPDRLPGTRPGNHLACNPGRRPPGTHATAPHRLRTPIYPRRIS